MASSAHTTATTIFDDYKSKAHSLEEIADENVILEELKIVIDDRFDLTYRHSIANFILHTMNLVYRENAPRTDERYEEVSNVVAELAKLVFPFWIEANSDCCSSGIWRKFYNLNLDEIIQNAFDKTSFGRRCTPTTQP